MVLLAPRVSKISVSIFRRELTRIVDLYFLMQSMHRCMVDLHSKLNGGRRDQRSIWQYLRAKKVSDDINNLRQRVQAIQDSFLVGGSLSLLSITRERAADPYNDHDAIRTLRCP